jgi:cytidylate kinase
MPVIRNVVIDGPAASGKSTAARRVAHTLGLKYLNTGDLFRAVALVSLVRDASGAELAAEVAKVEIDSEGAVTLDGEDVRNRLRRPDVTAAAARLGHQPEVVTALMALQRSTLIQGGYVADGRNLGSDVIPEASLKIYLTAMPESRAQRRALETGEPVAAVQAEIAERDLMDATRPLGALSLAEDAEVIDATSISVDEVVARIVRLATIRGFTAPGGGSDVCA